MKISGSGTEGNGLLSVEAADYLGLTGLTDWFSIADVFPLNLTIGCSADFSDPTGYFTMHMRFDEGGMGFDHPYIVNIQDDGSGSNQIASNIAYPIQAIRFEYMFCELSVEALIPGFQSQNYADNTAMIYDTFTAVDGTRLVDHDGEWGAHWTMIGDDPLGSSNPDSMAIYANALKKANGFFGSSNFQASGIVDGAAAAVTLEFDWKCDTDSLTTSFQIYMRDNLILWLNGSGGGNLLDISSFGQFPFTQHAFIFNQSYHFEYRIDAAGAIDLLIDGVSVAVGNLTVPLTDNERCRFLMSRFPGEDGMIIDNLAVYRP